jgi:hypothetical protein
MTANRMSRIVTMCLLAGALASVLAAQTSAKTLVATPSACRTGSITREAEPEPMALSGAPEPAALSMFGVLRRAAGPADQLPPLSRIGFEVDSELSSYYPGDIRQLVRLPNGSRYFVIPGFKRVPQLPPERCLPKQLRHLRRPEPEPVYCVAGVGPGVELSGTSCQTLAEIETGGDLAEAYFFSTPFQVDLVPDGVATVRLAYRGGTVITAPVSENAFMFTPPRGPIERAKAKLKRLGRTFELEGKHESKHLTRRQQRRRARVAIGLLDRVLAELPPKQVQWLDAGGHVLRSFTPHRDRNGLFITSGAVSTGAVPVG